MSTFSSILSSLQTGKVAQPVQTTHSPKAASKRIDAPTHAVLQSTRAETPTVAVKRKLDYDDKESARKVPKLAQLRTANPASVPVEVFNPRSSVPRARPVGSQAQNIGSTTASRAVVSATSKTSNPSSAGTEDKPAPKKRGFASLMAKAAAAQEANKASGPSTIKHKPVEKMSRRERHRQAMQAQQMATQHKRNRSGDEDRPSANKSNSNRRMDSPVPGTPKFEYHGTMRANVSADLSRRKVPKGTGQDKYGGYASWSDLDDAEDEGDSYDSGSDMEEAGYDEVMEEELKSARIARQEDDEAQKEEDRLKLEKVERKRRLTALNNNAAATKKRF